MPKSKKDKPIVAFNKVSKIYDKYRQEVVALEDIDFSVAKGEFVSIVGRSGTGKSTIIKLMIAEEKPTEGQVGVLGWDLNKIKDRQVPEFRRQLGVVFQDYKLLTRKTVYENVAYAMVVSGQSVVKIRKTVPQVLDLVGLKDKGRRFPKELSGGEQQRTAIARALVHKPNLLVADEMTGELDALYAWEIMEILLKINQMGTTVIIATHDRDIVNKINKRVITLEEGRIIRDQKQGDYLL
ncbi:cell division ATP-binding protein FtsE [Patescibacteria group bacterium]|nr:cell division ATP-binding protein FtsE [Patescibacteria group bacterium]